MHGCPLPAAEAAIRSDSRVRVACDTTVSSGLEPVRRHVPRDDGLIPHARRPRAPPENTHIDCDSTCSWRIIRLWRLSCLVSLDRPSCIPSSRIGPPPPTPRMTTVIRAPSRVAGRSTNQALLHVRRSEDKRSTPRVPERTHTRALRIVDESAAVCGRAMAQPDMRRHPVTVHGLHPVTRVEARPAVVAPPLPDGQPQSETRRRPRD